MKKSIAIACIIIILVFAFVFSPLLAKNPVLYPSLPVLWTITAIFFLLILTSLISLYRTIVHRDAARAILNFVISLTLVTYLLPIFFNVFNVALFTSQHKVTGVIEVNKIKDKEVCEQEEPLKGKVPYSKIKDDTIEILCPIESTTESYLYKTKVITSSEYKDL